MLVDPPAWTPAWTTSVLPRGPEAYRRLELQISLMPGDSTEKIRPADLCDDCLKGIRRGP